MYELFIANKNYSSWSLRPWILMRMLDIPFDERPMPFPEPMGFAAFRDVSPSGKVPSLQHGDIVVWDSLAIAEYLHERHRGVWPADATARAWARSASAEMHSGFAALRNVCGMNCGIRVKLADVSPELQHDVARIAELWRDGLSRFAGPFLAGEAFSAADAFFCPVAFRVQTYGLDLDPTAAAYARRLLALPAMQDWYRAALVETWRIPKYEAEARAAGEWMEDLRANP